MILYEHVRSSIKPPAIEFDEYSVYVNSKIVEILTIDDSVSYTEWEFEQIKYDKNEYIQLVMAGQLQTISDLSDTVDTLLIAMLEGDD